MIYCEGVFSILFQVMRAMMKAKRKAHNVLRKELIYEQKKLVKEEQAEAGDKDEEKPNQTKPKPEEVNKPKKPASDKNGTPFTFEENEVMTRYDGFWVKKDAVVKLDRIKAKNTRTILKARDNDSKDQKLTEEEEIELRRAMKKEKRRMYRQLISFLGAQGRFEQSDIKDEIVHNDNSLAKRKDDSLAKIKTEKTMKLKSMSDG